MDMLFFTPWASSWDQRVVCVILVSYGNVNISRFMMRKVTIFLDEAVHSIRDKRSTLPDHRAEIIV